MGNGVDPDVATEFAGFDSTDTELSRAWSAMDDSGDELAPRFTPGRITALAVTGSVTVTIAAGVLAAHHLRSTPAPLEAVESTTVVVAPPEPSAPPEPRASFVADVPDARTMNLPPPPPPPPAAAPGLTPELLAAFDQQFIANLQADHWTITDATLITQNGHKVCALLQQGATPQMIAQRLVEAASLDPTEAQSFVVTAMATYPDCP